MIAAERRPPPAGGAPGGGKPVVGVAVSVLLHAALLGGLLWWNLRDKPAEPVTEGLELVWEQQPREAALAAEGGPPPGAPPEVPAPETPGAPPEPPSAPPAPAAPPAAVRPPVAPPAPAMAAVPRFQEASPLPPLANAVLPPPPPDAAAETPVAEAPATTAVPDVRVPPLRLPQTAQAPPAAVPRRPSPPPRQTGAPRTQRPADQPGAPGAETAAAASAGGAVLRGITTVPSEDPNFPRGTPRYPPSSQARGEQGRVFIRMTVGPDGRVQAVGIIRSSGYPALDEEARRHVLQNWRYRPAMRDGEPVTATVETGILFTLN